MKTIHPKRNGLGFTVPEILAVVAIIIIVISLLLPAMVRSKQTVHATICATRLHNLHQGYTARQVEVKTGAVKPMTSSSWQASLSPYVGGISEVMKCTHADLGQDGSDAFFPGGNSSSNAATTVYLKVFNAYPNGYLYDMAMEPGPLCRQIDKGTTDAQIDQLWSAYPSIATTIKNLRNQLSTTPYSYLLCFEDLRPDGGDKDYEDVIFSVTESNTGVDVKFLYDGAGYQFDLVNQDGVVVAAQLDNGGQTKPGTVIPVAGASSLAGGDTTSGGGIASFGMNNAVADKSKAKPGKNVIFMMDYSRSVAKGGWGNSGYDRWEDWIVPVTGLPRFARHWNKANVMFFDGGVRLMDPALIDPKITQYRTDYWIP